MLFSIITATYNSEKTIEYTMSSLLSQTYKNFEHVVIDGNSTDNTLKILKSREGLFQKIISEPDNGIFDALNKGIKESSGDYVGFLHSDDAFASSEILSYLQTSIVKDDPDIIYGNLNYILNDKKGKVVRVWRAGEFNLDSLKYGWMPPHPAFFMKRSLYQTLGGFNTDYKISADFDAVIRYLKNSDLKVDYIDKVFVNMRVGGNSSKISNILPKMREDFSIFKENGFNPVLGLFCKNFRKINQIRVF